MIIHDLDVIGVIVLPDEAHAPLVVDAHAVLSSPLTCKGFEAIAGWSPEIIERPCVVQLQKVPMADP
jgi:hypothetical protein